MAASDAVAPMTINHTSADLFRQCAARYRFERIEHADRLTSLPAVIGDALHKAIELDLQETSAAYRASAIRRYTGHFGENVPSHQEPLPLRSYDALLTSYHAAFASRVAREPYAALIPASWQEAAHRFAYAALTAYCAQRVRLWPISAEQAFAFAHPDAPEALRVNGRIDALTLRPLVEPIGSPLTPATQWLRRIIDWKFTGKPWSPDEAWRRTQATDYLWADQMGAFGPLVPEEWQPVIRAAQIQPIAVTFVVFAGLQQIQPGYRPLTQPEQIRTQTFATYRSPKQVTMERTALLTTARLIERARASDTFPTSTGPLCAWCSFLHVCRSGQAYLRQTDRPAMVWLPDPGLVERPRPHPTTSEMPVSQQPTAGVTVGGISASE